MTHHQNVLLDPRPKKLTNEQIAYIKSSNRDQRFLASEFEVSQSSISRYKNR
jgi:hypothetical protein